MNTFSELLRALAKATEENRVAWEPMDLNSYRTQLKDGSVVISRDTDWDPDENGNAVSSTVLRAWVTNPKGLRVDDGDFHAGSEEYALIQRLFLTARRNAMKSDELFGRMIHSLQPVGS